MISASGFVDALTKVIIGHRPSVAAAASCASRRRSNSSPASSHAAVTVTSSHSPDVIRTTESWVKMLASLAAT